MVAVKISLILDPIPIPRSVAGPASSIELTSMTVQILTTPSESSEAICNDSDVSPAVLLCWVPGAKMDTLSKLAACPPSAVASVVYDGVRKPLKTPML